MTINNDFNFHDLDEGMLCPDLFPIEPPNMNPATSKMAALSLRMKKMTIEEHTQKLWQLIEHTKRHRVESTMQKVKNDVVSHKQLLHHLQQGDAARQKQLNDMRQHYEDKLIRVSTTAYRGLARVHQLLITFTPYIPMTVEAYAKVSYLNYELYRTVDQLKNQSESVEVIESCVL